VPTPAKEISAMSVASQGHVDKSRERLANRRAAETFDLEADGQRYCATVGRFPDGRLAEIFLSAAKCGSQADTNARDSAVVLSIAVQHGVPLDMLRKALMRNSRGLPCGPLAVALDMVATGQDEGDQ
jgi:hypothetical protein